MAPFRAVSTSSILL